MGEVQTSSFQHVFFFWLQNMQGFGMMPFPMGYNPMGGMQYGFPPAVGSVPFTQSQMHPMMQPQARGSFCPVPSAPCVPVVLAL